MVAPAVSLQFYLPDPSEVLHPTLTFHLTPVLKQLLQHNILEPLQENQTLLIRDNLQFFLISNLMFR